MKTLGGVILFFSCFFALMIVLVRFEHFPDWNLQGYLLYLTENLQSLPTFEIKNFAFSDPFSFFKQLCSFLAFPFNWVKVFIQNICVVFFGFFPFSFADGGIIR